MESSYCARYMTRNSELELYFCYLNIVKKLLALLLVKTTIRAEANYTGFKFVIVSLHIPLVKILLTLTCMWQCYVKIDSRT